MDEMKRVKLNTLIENLKDIIFKISELENIHIELINEIRNTLLINDEIVYKEELEKIKSLRETNEQELKNIIIPSINKKIDSLI